MAWSKERGDEREQPRSWGPELTHRSRRADGVARATEGPWHASTILFAHLWVD